MLIMLFMTHVYPRNIRKYKILAAQRKAEYDKLRKEYDAQLDAYTEWFLTLEKRLSEMADIVYDKIDDK